MTYYLEWSLMKRKNPKAICIYRTGEFYETYDEDAEKLSRDYGLSLISGPTNILDFPPIREVVIPYHLIDGLVGNLLREKVNFCVINP